MHKNTKINTSTIEDIKKCYKIYAPIYDYIFGRILHQGRISAIKEVEKINPHNILEIGVGTGLTLPMYPHHIPVTGIDISQEMLTKAAYKIPYNRHAPIDLFEAHGEHLPFEDSSFSCVVLPYTYSVTPNPQKLAEEIRRVCTPSGSIIILNHFSGFRSIWNGFELLAKPFAQKIGFHSEFPYDEHINALDWEVIKSYPVNLLGLSRVVVINNHQ